MGVFEQVYHRSPHAGLAGITLFARDTSKTYPGFARRGPLAATLDDLFRHRVSRLVGKNGTVPVQGQRFEVPFELSGKTVCLVVDPHAETVIGAATPLDALANATRQRRPPEPGDASPPRKAASGANLIELIYQLYNDR